MKEIIKHEQKEPAFTISKIDRIEEGKATNVIDAFVENSSL